VGFTCVFIASLVLGSGRKGGPLGPLAVSI
jgi:hypothetical protein